MGLSTYLDSRDVGVLADVLVLVQGILGELSLLLLDGQLDQEEHDRLQRRNGDIARPLGVDVVVKQGQGRRGLLDPDQLVGPLQDILRLLVRRRRLWTGWWLAMRSQRWHREVQQPSGEGVEG